MLGARIKNFCWYAVRPVGLVLVWLVLVGGVLALNDPGHDTLYVLKVGDSNVSGSINLTGGVTTQLLKVATVVQGDFLDLWVNGSINPISSRPAIQATANDLYIDSNGDLHIATLGGTTGIVQMGDPVTNRITLNVSGTILQSNVKVCLANGTNCIGGNNTGNISSLQQGSGITVSGGNGPVATIGTNATTCSAGQFSYWSGSAWLCAAPTGISSAGGWTNTSTQVSLSNSANNVSATTLFVDNTNGRVGIGTTAPTQQLDVNGSINITSNLTATFVQFTNKAFGSLLDIVANGTDLGASPPVPRIQGVSGNALFIDAPGNLYLNRYGGTTGIVQVGDPTTSAITLNVSGTILQSNVKLCLANGTNCVNGNNTGNVSSVTNGNGITVTNPNGPTVTVSTNAATCTGGQFSYWTGSAWQCAAPTGISSAGGWTNTSTVTSTGLDVNIGSGTLYVNSTSGTVGIATAAVSNVGLNVVPTYTGTSASWYGGQIALGLNSTANNAYSQAGFIGSVWVNPGSSMNYTGALYGIKYIFGTQGTGTIRQAVVINSQGRVYSGTVTSLSMFEGFLNSNAGTITNTYGLYLGGLTAGTQTNQPYAIYSSDSNARSYFAGNIGINNTAPASTLDVVGNASISGALYAGGSQACTSANGLCGSGGANVSGSGTQNYVTKWSNTTSLTNSVLYDDGTNIGVGTATLTQKLTVAGGANFSGTVYASNISSNSPLQLQTQGTTRIYVNDTNGNVGINNTSPASALDVAGTITASTQFTGPGTGLTGTASSLSIGGNAATASNLATGTYTYGSGSIIVNSNNSALLNGQASTYYLDTSGTAQTKTGNLQAATITASTQFTGAGTGLTGTASSLSIGGNAATATTAANIAGGSAGAIPFQTATGTTSFDASNLVWDNTNKRLGIGTTTPLTALEVTGDGAILANGTYGSGWTEPGLGAGTRLLWYPYKAAFRAGFVDGTQWNDANIGSYSIAMGYDTSASGYYSTAMGYGTNASGQSSTAMGRSTTASGVYSTAMGYGTNARNSFSTAMGYSTTASSYYSTAMGYGTNASGQSSTAMGYENVATGSASTAMGYITIASGDYSTAMGASMIASGVASTAMGYGTTASGYTSTAMGYNTIANGSYSTAMGRSTTANAYESVAIGRYNVGGGTATSWVATDPLFEIGIGTGQFATANALTVLKNGNVGIGTATPSVMLEVNGSVKVDGDLNISGSGNELFVANGTNGCMGRATLSGSTGTVTVSTTCVSGNSNIFLTTQVPGTAPGFLYISARTPGTNFTISSGSGTDNSTVAWLIVDPTT